VATEYLPIISAAEYEAFREFLPQLPVTYDEFKSQTAGMQRYLQGNGEDIEYVDVNLAGFKNWCCANVNQQNSNGLLQFMRSQADGY